MENKKYRVVIAESGKRDVKEKKKYILQHFKYREYAESFSQKIKAAAMQLKVFPTGYETTGFQYRGYNIYMKPQSNHLLFILLMKELQRLQFFVCFRMVWIGNT